MRSRISGLGGTVAVHDAALAFKTADFRTSGGSLKLEIRLGGLKTKAPFLFLELLNRCDLRNNLTRLAIISIELGLLHDETPYIVEMPVHDNIHYVVSGFIHGNEPVEAKYLTITADRAVLSDQKLKNSAEKLQKVESEEEDARGIGAVRLIETADPSFAYITSQPLTANQLDDPIFAQTRSAMKMDPALSNEAAWSDAYVYRALQTYGVLEEGKLGFGLDAGEQLAWPAILRTGADVQILSQNDDPEFCADLGEIRGKMLSGHDMQQNAHGTSLRFDFINDELPEYLHELADFAWWIAPPEIERADMFKGAKLVLDSVRRGGIAVLVVPATPKAPSVDQVPTADRNDILRMALDAVSRGYQIAQIRIPQTRTSTLAMGGQALFGFIALRAASSNI